MKSIYYVGLDVHKKTISFCIKTFRGELVGEGTIAANREALQQWAGFLDMPWIGALEATMFSGWIYDFLKPCALDLKVAHPEMLKAIVAAKKKNDRIDARKICDLLRCDLLPECYMAPTPIRDLRRVLRYRNLVVRESVRMKNKVAGLLMEVGVSYSKRRLHGKQYFQELLENIEDVPESIHLLLSLSRAKLNLCQEVQKNLLEMLKNDRQIYERVRRLMTIPAVGEVTALTWALEVGDPRRFRSIGQAVSYCGLCSAEKESGGRNYRGPISKKRNKHLQTVLIEAAKLAPRYNEALALVYAREVKRGHKNRATLAVARKLVAYLLAVDKRAADFEVGMETKAA
jgi:transposase